MQPPAGQRKKAQRATTVRAGISRPLRRGWRTAGLLALLAGCGAETSGKLKPTDGQGGGAASGQGGGAGFTPPMFSPPKLAPQNAGGSSGTASPAEPLVPSPKWSGKFVDPGLGGADPSGTFGGAAAPDPALALSYPLDHSMHPVNIEDITIQWGGAAGTYRLRFENDRGTFDVFVSCTAAPCRYAVPSATWRTIARANPDEDVAITVARADGGRVAVSPPTSIRFTPAPVEGGLYYWSTSLRGTYRLTFGQKKATPFITPENEGCYGCHTVSRNGQRIAWTNMDNSKTLLGATTEMPNSRTGDTTMLSATLALTPDGSQLLVAQGGKIDARDAVTGAMLKENTTAAFGGQGAYFPEFSPDGKRVAVTLAPPPPRSFVFTEDFMLSSGAVGLLDYDGGTLSNLKVLVNKTTDEISYYPSWSPDGRWIAFTSAVLGGARANPTPTYDNAKSRLRLISADGQSTYELALATQGTGKTSDWPKFTPFAQLNGQLLFITFNSKMAYGSLLKDGERPQLWLAAIDLRKIGQGDPSWAPVWLPFQEVDQNNHLGFWTEKVVCQQENASSEGSSCGDGATCYQGRCVLPVE